MEAFKQNNMEASDSERRRTWLELESTDDRQQKALINEYDDYWYRRTLELVEKRFRFSRAMHRIFGGNLDVIHSPMATTLHMQNHTDDDDAAGSFDGVFAIPCGEIRGGGGMDGHSLNGIHLPMIIHGASGFIDAIPSREIRGDPFCFVSRSSTTTRRADEAATQSPDIWYYDTASSFSMTGNLHLLHNIHAAPLVTATSATGHTVSSELCGRVSGTVNLSGVRYFPGAPNLISAGHLVRQLGCAATMKGQSCTITNQDDIVVGIGRMLDNNVMVLDMLGDYSLGSTCSVCPWPWNHN